MVIRTDSFQNKEGSPFVQGHISKCPPVFAINSMKQDSVPSERTVPSSINVSPAATVGIQPSNVSSSQTRALQSQSPVPSSLPWPQQELPTPIKPAKLAGLLRGYDPELSEFLLEGFRNGFRVGYEGNELGSEVRWSNNLKSAVDNPRVMSDKIKKERDAGRVAGPFQEPPFSNMVISPQGLVLKATGVDFRRIHHLSYPKGGPSVNSGIPESSSAVHYTRVDEAIAAIKRVGKFAYMWKSDILHAYRNLPMSPADYYLLGFTWPDENNRTMFYYDRCLAMGLSSSCQIFERFSSALEWIGKNKFELIELEHMLDDFFGVNDVRDSALRDLSNFQKMCEVIGVPLAPGKTEGPTQQIKFLGIELLSETMESKLPEDKRLKTLEAIHDFLPCKKVTLKQIQTLAGLLQYACLVIPAGRPFLRRLSNLTIGLKQAHHTKKVTWETRRDLKVWQEFLHNFNGRSFFVEDGWLSSDVLNLYTDSSKLGFGLTMGTHWSFGEWDEEFRGLNIAILEFYPIVLSVALWARKFANRYVYFHTDNEALVFVMNNMSSREPLILQLLRKLVLICLNHNICFRALHIPGCQNNQCDALSRLQRERFWEASRGMSAPMDPYPLPVPGRFHHRHWLRLEKS